MKETGDGVEAKRKGKKVKIKPDGEGFEMEITEDDGEAKEPDANTER
jgi:hypothetical protein